MKTTLKTAKFTLKTAFARCIAANAVVVSCIFVAKVAKWWVRLRHVLSWLRRFLCVFQAFAMFICGENAVRKWRKYGAKTAKWWCGNGGLDLQFRLKFIVLRRLRGAFLAFPTMISRISQSIPPFSLPFCSKSASYINISHLPKPPNLHSNRRKQC